MNICEEDPECLVMPLLVDGQSACLARAGLKCMSALGVKNLFNVVMDVSLDVLEFKAGLKLKTL